MTAEFLAAVAKDRHYSAWCGDLSLFGDSWPDPTAFEEPAVSEVVEGVAVVRVPRLITRAGWRRLAEVVAGAVGDEKVNAVLLAIDTAATQVRGTAECVAEIRNLAAVKPIAGHVSGTAQGGGLVLLQACTKRSADKEALLGLGREGKPFARPECN
jgi:ClpP class serine protease